MPRGRPFKKGQPRLPNAGRKPGSLNKLTRDVKEFMRELVDDPEIQDSVRAQILKGDRGAMAGFLGVAAHVVGRPKETVELSTSPSLAKLLVLAAESAKAKKEEK